MSRPRVRAVVVDYNGGDLTIACLEHLVATDQPEAELEIVLVDNASTESVVDRVRRELPAVRVIESAVNLGFGGGCNLGMADLDADYVALVNNDVTVPPGWLGPLLDAMVSDGKVGAASPKILLRRRYSEVRLQSPTVRPGHGDGRELGVRITGARSAGRDVRGELRIPEGTYGPELDAAGHEFQWTGADARLLIPVIDEGSHCVELRLDAPREVSVSATSGGERLTLAVGPQPAWYALPGAGEPFDVVNNVGTHLVADGYGADRGWLERDRGQYDHREDVFAWCGAAVLLRYDYLRDVGTFDERLFLYSEDLELAWRGLQRGWRHRFVPASVVRHVHSATTEQVPRAAMLKERNRLLVLVRHASPGFVLRAVLRYGLTTASYTRRDVVVPLRAGQAARPAQVRLRIRAFGGFLRLAPAMVVSRRRDRARRPST